MCTSKIQSDFRRSLLLGIVLFSFIGCKEKIVMKDINTSTEVKTSVAAPVLTFNATMADILGIDPNDGKGQSSKVKPLYAKVGPEDVQLPSEIPYGTLFYRDTFVITRDFHYIELSNYLPPVDFRFEPYEQTVKYLDDNNIEYEHLISETEEYAIVPEGIHWPLEFPVTIHLKGVNSKDVTTRIDSMIIKEAKFRSRLETSFGLQVGEIRNLEIVTPRAFTRKGKPFGAIKVDPVNVEYADIEIDEPNFEISLQDGKATRGNRRAHMVDSLTFIIRFDIRTLVPHRIDFKKTKLHYRLYVQLLTFDALFGYFEPSQYMKDKDYQDLSEGWAGWNDIKQINMNLLYPSIRILVDHQIATEPEFPLNVNVNNVWVAPKKPSGAVGQKNYAGFGSDGTQRSTVWELGEGEKVRSSYIDPLFDPVSKIAHNEYIVGYTGFKNAKGEETGQLDKLFATRPDFIGYDFFITIGKPGDPKALESQFRLVNNTYIALSAVVVVPLICGEGSTFEYNDTTDINFQSFSIDSLAAQTNWIDTVMDGHFYVYLYAKNSIPYNLNAEYELLDADNKPINLPVIQGDEGEEMSHHTTIPAPTEYDKTTHIATNFGEKKIILRVDKKDFERLRDARKLRFKASISDNPQTATIWYDSSLSVTLGVSANLQAIIEL